MRQRYEELLSMTKEVGREITAMLEKDNGKTEDWQRFIVVCAGFVLARFPRSFARMRIRNAPKILQKNDPELYDTVKAAMVRGVQFQFNALCYDQQQLAEARKRLVERGLRPVAGDKRLKLGEVWESSYSTQGFGARQYAEGSAKLRALNAQALGIKTEIETTVRRFDHSVCWSGNRETATFHVWVFVESETDVEIIKQCPAMTLRDQVKACWANHVNPRVFNPFLPVGYEESVGLDYFGGETRKAAG
jgi:hypothetical protein